MTDVDAQVQFATEFALFLVALAGLALSLLRAELLTRSTAARLALAVSFAALGSAAFAHGSLIVEDPEDTIVLAALVVGWLALGAGSVRWEGGRFSQGSLQAGTALGLAAVAATVAGSDIVAAGLRALAALGVGLALLQASRKAIAARVAASSAATLLLVVLVLSVGLSAVLSNTVEDQAIAAVDARAIREASLIEAARDQAIQRALVAGRGLAVGVDTGAAIRAISETGSASLDHVDNLERGLEVFTTVVYVGENLALAYADNRLGVVVATQLPAAAFVELLGTAAVREARDNNSSAGDLVDLGDMAIALGVVAVQDPTTNQVVGAVLAAEQIDAAYLQGRARAEETVGLSLWSPRGRIATYGAQPPADVATDLGADVFGNEQTTTRRTDDHFVAARAVRSQNNQPLFTLVATRSTNAVDDVRERLFRTFFVIAFGGTLLALVLAAFVGDRIGAGVRRLTTSAEELERGETGVRSGVRSEDEVGRLGTAFDAMAASIEEKTDALRQAALDEARLRNRVEAIVAGMGEALVAVDDAARITDVNATAEELLGIAADEAKGRPIADVVRLRTEEGTDLSAHLRVEDGPRWSEVAEVESTLGEQIPVAVTAAPLRGPAGEVAGRVLVLRDLRAEHEVERMKREFLSRVGHELRTPLTPLLGYARILAGRSLEPERAKDISKLMVSSGERLERIVEMLEFFASTQAGRTVLRPETIDVRDLLATVVDARDAASSNSHALSRRVRSGTPAILGDRYWLQRSIDELIDNAIKFSPGGGRVSVTAGPVDGNVEIAVRDTGVGMSPEEVERAFAEWTQGDESDTRAYGGLGLGLALVQRVAERHGGRVVCETAPGKGSKFSILLPALPTERSDAPTPRGRAAAGGSGDDDVRMPEGDAGTG